MQSAQTGFPTGVHAPGTYVYSPGAVPSGSPYPPNSQQAYPPQFYGQPPYPPQPNPNQAYVQYPYSGTSGTPSAPNAGYTGGPVFSNVFAQRSKFTGESFEACDFDDTRLRNRFIRKVYLILFLQLGLTGAFISLCILLPVICKWIKRNPIFVYVSYGLFLTLYFMLVCCPKIRRNFPGNYIALLIFTLAFSYVAGAVSCMYTTSSVLTAVLITAVTCVTVSIVAATTSIDFTKCTALIMVLSIGLLLFGLACMIVYFVSGPNAILSTVYGGVAACIFVLYLAFDTQMIVGGRKYEFSAEDYIYGALQLYMDVMNLFLIILGLSGQQE